MYFHLELRSLFEIGLTFALILRLKVVLQCILRSKFVIIFVTILIAVFEYKTLNCLYSYFYCYSCYSYSRTVIVALVSLDGRSILNGSIKINTNFYGNLNACNNTLVYICIFILTYDYALIYI